MVSLRALENAAEIRLEKRDDIPWERIRSEMQWWLLRRGMDDSQAEEIVDEAIVRIFATMPEADHVANPGRIKIDIRMTIGSILHEQAAERAMFRHDMQDDWEDITTDRRLSRLTPAKTQTHVNDAIANRRATERLFRWFSKTYFPVSMPVN